MSRTIDNVIAFRILYMLVTPFDATDAYRLGIIDANGTALKKIRDLNTSEEKDAYTSLHRLVFSLKKLLQKVPGGKSKLASLVAAYWLVKESYTNGTKITESMFMQSIDLIESKKITLVEEQLTIERFIRLVEDGGAIANTAGAATATDQAAIKKNKDGILGAPKYMFKRNKKNVEMG
jgi:hypothetical protein